MNGAMGVGFAYFCWQRQKRPDEMPPGLYWDDQGYLCGSPTLPGKYRIECRKGVSTPIEVVPPPWPLKLAI